jgi:general secretion pathway protein L
MKTFLRSWLSTLQVLENRLCYQWRRSVLPAFFRWWRKELVDCLPQKWKERLETSEKEILLHWHTGSFGDSLSIQSTRDAMLTGEPQSRKILVLPYEEILLEPIQLPAAALADAETAVAFEMDKYTPFTSKQVYFDLVWDQMYSSLSGSSNLLLVVVLRKRLDSILDKAAGEGLSFDAVDVLDEQQKRVNINLLPLSHRPQKNNPARYIKHSFAISGIALLVSVMLLWVSNRQDTLGEMNMQVRALRNATQQTKTLQEQLNTALTTGRFIQNQKTQAVSKASLLRELTVCIPASTWLEQLEVSQAGEINLNGQSSQANELIGKMKSCNSLENIRFQGIIQPDRSTGLDRFNLTARLRTKDDSHAPPPISP